CFFLLAACTEEEITPDSETTDPEFIDPITINPECGPSQERVGSCGLFEAHPNDRLLLRRLPSDELYPLANRRNLQEFTKDFYTEYADEFDFIIVLVNRPVGTRPNVPVEGIFHTVVNEVTQGIGSKGSGNPQDWGSSGRLQGAIVLYDVRAEPDGTDGTQNYIISRPFYHELAHRWGNAWLPQELGGGSGHYGYSTADSPIGGWEAFEPTGETINGKKEYHAIRGNHFWNARLSNLELYLMGLIPQSDLEPLQYLTDVERSPNDTSFEDYYLASDLKTLSTDEMVELMGGPRIPAFGDAQKEFRTAFVIVSDEEVPSAHQDLADEEIRIFGSTERTDPEDRWTLFKMNSFYDATGGRAYMNTSCLSQARLCN
ncbi:hypothetical protein, partial [Xanthovirga aplysinae]|uniref:hypothetical protein n=1 Tax=Xanthovirga aplysinae TaxID=2529853 RepID=UPI0016573415